MQEYIFYPAVKEEDKYYPLLFNRDGEPESIFWRSRSFIDGGFFTTCKIDKDKISGRFPGEELFVVSEDVLEQNATGGLVTGYVTLTEMAEYYKDEIWLEDMDIVPPEVYCEFPVATREMYGKFSAIDHCSTGYICSHLHEILDDIYVEKGEKCYIVHFSY